MTVKTRQSIVSRMQVSVLWRHMLLMLVVLALSLTALLISNKISLDTLEKEKYLEIQTALDRNCDEFTTEMLMTGSLSNAVTGGRYYDYIRGIRNGVLPERYYTVLPLLQNSLSTQVYLRGDASITLMYLSGCNSLVSTLYVSPKAEAFFNNIINFPETPTSVLIGYLKTSGVLKILPMQKIRINVGSNPGNISEVLPVVIRDLNAPASIMSLYPQEVVLQKLGLDSLPADTYIQMTADDGQILLRYPEQFDASQLESERIRFDTSMNSVHANVSIWVSRSAISRLLLPARLTGSLLVVFVALVGLVLSFVLSRISVDPLRKLVAHHSDDPRRSTNEIIHLSSILSRSKEKVQDLESALVGSLLAKVFSGIVLSEEDEGNPANPDPSGGQRIPGSHPGWPAGSHQDLLPNAERGAGYFPDSDQPQPGRRRFLRGPECPGRIYRKMEPGCGASRSWHPLRYQRPLLRSDHALHRHSSGPLRSSCRSGYQSIPGRPASQPHLLPAAA